MPTIKFSDMPPTWACDHQIEADWIAGPCSATPLSDKLETSNYTTLEDVLDTADPYGQDWGVAIWDHFGTHSIEMLFVRPNSGCARICESARKILTSQPNLNYLRKPNG